MRHLLGVLLLCAGLAVAQGGDEDGGISIDDKPTGPETEPAKKAAPPTAAPARTPGQKVATVKVEKKGFALTVPSDWVLQEYEESGAELAWDLHLPGSTKRASLDLIRIERADPRSWPYYQAEWWRNNKPDEKPEVRVKPSPRIVISRSRDGADWNDLMLPVSVKNNVFAFRLSCAAEDLPQAEGDLLLTVRSFTANVELSPPIPKGYETSQEGVWLIARSPNVTASLKPLVKTLKDAEKRFRHEHGPLPKSDAPLVVLVQASKADGAKIEPKVGETQLDVYGDHANRRMFAVPFEKDNLDSAGFLTDVASGLLFQAKYGDIRPRWVVSGESTVARAEVYTGKPLPSLDEGFVGWASTLKLHRLDQLDGLLQNDNETWNKESFFYVAALREGKYRKQYKAFLDDFAETADGPGAFARHLGTIDQEDLKAATMSYLDRIRPEKRK
jgi:hypothetical protein